jgi:hypothetical protein
VLPEALGDAGGDGEEAAMAGALADRRPPAGTEVDRVEADGEGGVTFAVAPMYWVAGSGSVSVLVSSAAAYSSIAFSSMRTAVARSATQAQAARTWSGTEAGEPSGGGWVVIYPPLHGDWIHDSRPN